MLSRCITGEHSSVRWLACCRPRTETNRGLSACRRSSQRPYRWLRDEHAVGHDAANRLSAVLALSQPLSLAWSHCDEAGCSRTNSREKACAFRSGQSTIAPGRHSATSVACLRRAESADHTIFDEQRNHRIGLSTRRQYSRAGQFDKKSGRSVPVG